MDGELFEMERRTSGRGARLALRGELDFEAARELQGFLDELDAGGFDRVVIDLRELTFMDSAGMSFIYRLVHWGRNTGRALVFTRPIPGVLHKLEIAGVVRQLRFVEPDRVDAKAE